MRSWMKFIAVGCAVTLLIVFVGIIDGQAAQSARVQVIQHGDFVLIGNTLAQDCASGVAAPVVGTVGNCGTNVLDSASDVFWRADSPANGQAEANTGIIASQARSTAILNLPTGTQVTHAYLYWAAKNSTANADVIVTMDRVGAFSQSITALTAYTGADNSYESVADVTGLVQAHGSGAYRVSGVDAINLVNLNDDTAFASWWMVVIYRLDSDPIRHITLYDGFDQIASGFPMTTAISGFNVPAVGYTGKVGIVGLEGDSTKTGDSLAIDGMKISDPYNPFDNFFNSSRSFLGSAVSVAGDLPQLSGSINSQSGMDMDVIDITPFLTPGKTSAVISANSTSDAYFLGTAVTSITTYNWILNVTKTGSGSVSSSPAGINCGAVCSVAYMPDATVTLTANPDTNSTFSGWSGDADCLDGSVTMNVDKTCTANFVTYRRYLPILLTWQ